MVVVRCLILCSKFAEKIVCRLGSAGPAAVYTLQRSHRPSSWIMGEGSEKGRWKGRRGREGKGKEGAAEKEVRTQGKKREKRGKGRGGRGIPPPNGNTGYGPAQRHTLDVERKCLNGVN